MGAGDGRALRPRPRRRRCAADRRFRRAVPAGGVRQLPGAARDARREPIRRAREAHAGLPAIEGVALDIPDGQGRRKRFGNMVLSRYPVGQVLRWTLPWEADHTRNMPRGLIEAVVMAPFGPVRVMTTHLEYSSDGLRRAEVEGIREAHRS